MYSSLEQYDAERKSKLQRSSG